MTAVTAPEALTPEADAAPEAPRTLSALLRTGTRPEHSEAETMGFIEALMKGELTREAYADLAAQQWVIYRALEESGRDVSRDPRGATLLFDELLRVPSIEADLAFLYGDDWATKIRILPATERYAARLLEVREWLGGWAAHAYTRYLGDLSGGQVIRRVLQRSYGFGEEGTTFYHFTEIDKLKPFKDIYRERLDALAFDDAEAERVVAEAKAAFRLNQELFAELGTVHLPA